MLTTTHSEINQIFRFGVVAARFRGVGGVHLREGEGAEKVPREAP